ncbi:ATP-binding cassette sub-family A member 17-like [Haemaphysalis longicornis]
MELRFKDERFEPAPKDVFPVLHVEDLTVSYGGHEALKCISFQAFQNQVTVLVGRNGAGKTTLMNVIAGLVKPSSGKVYVYGYDVVKYASIVHSVMTYCPQRDMLFSDLTVWEHLIYFGTLKQLEPKDLRAAAEEALVLANLEKSGNRLVEDLRRGSLKRLGIAVGFLAKPKVVLIDEATSGLDQRNTRIIWDILLQSRGKNTVILTTHNMTEADVFAHRVVGLSAGTIVCNASPHYLKKIYGTRKKRKKKRG